MNHTTIVTHLSRITDPSEVIFTVTMQDVTGAIVRRMGTAALTLTAAELELAREEVKEAIDHNLEIRPYITKALRGYFCFEEGRIIMEFDGGLTRDHVECLAQPWETFLLSTNSAYSGESDQRN
jgi:hypothetical protein